MWVVLEEMQAGGVSLIRRKVLVNVALFVFNGKIIYVAHERLN